jgi:acyl carrier protein
VGGASFREAARQVRGMRENHQLSVISNEIDVANRSVRDEVASIFEQVIGHPVQINDDTDIVEDLGMDSLGVMNFVMAIEDFYDISIPLDRITQVQTVADLIAAVEELRSEA